MADTSDAGPLRDGPNATENDKLSEVAILLLRMEDLRDRGFTSSQIATVMSDSGHEVPTGGPWDSTVVEQMLTALDAYKEVAPPTVLSPEVAAADPQLLGFEDEPHFAAATIQFEQKSQPAPFATLTARPGLRRLLLGALGLGVISFGALAVLAATRGDEADEVTATDQLSSSEITAATIEIATADQDDTADQGDTAGLEPADAEDADPADMMSIRIEPERAEADDAATGSVPAATATIKEDGLLHLEGAFPSQEEADRYIDGVSEVFGRESIVESYVIDAGAPLPEVSDVALDKPVLFASGTATIDPDYIPFLEACGDVLKLNSHITMSIAAFTDSTGSEDFNLELSQQRAQAIHDFYRQLEVDDTQLLSIGYGEADPVADNESEAGRQQNRRAMLQLLDVMADDNAP